VSPKTYSLWRSPELVLGPADSPENGVSNLSTGSQLQFQPAIVLVAVAVSVVPALKEIGSVDCVD
jgi:hypothetical protein